MATRIQPASSNPYGGAVVFDSSPYTQYHLQRQAQERAKEEALDNYFRDIDSKINPAGMRTQEIPILLQQQNEDRKYYLQNKDAIKNPATDNGKSYNEYMARLQAKKAFIENSKRKGEIYKQIVPIFADPNKRSLMGDEAISALEEHDLPLTDPRHKEFDITKINYNPKPFEEAKYRTGLNPYIKEVAGETSFVPVPDTDPKNPQYLRKPVTKVLQNFDKAQIAQVAETEYASNPSFRKLVRDIEANPTQYEKYNKIYKQAFGKEFDIQHPEQIAVAHTISLMPQGYTKEGKPEIDQVAFDAAKYARAEADRRERQRRSFANQKELLGLQESQGNEFDRIGSVKPIETKQGSTIKGGLVYDKDGNPRTGEIVIAKEELPASIYSILKASNIEIKEPKLTMVTENGQIVGLISKKYGLIDRKTLENAQLNFNKEPQKGKQMQFGKPSPTTKPAKDPLGIFK